MAVCNGEPWPDITIRPGYERYLRRNAIVFRTDWYRVRFPSLEKYGFLVCAILKHPCGHRKIRVLQQYLMTALYPGDIIIFCHAVKSANAEIFGP
jgi:hypothetical protein